MRQAASSRRRRPLGRARRGTPRRRETRLPRPPQRSLMLMRTRWASPLVLIAWFLLIGGGTQVAPYPAAVHADRHKSSAQLTLHIAICTSSAAQYEMTAH